MSENKHDTRQDIYAAKRAATSERVQAAIDEIQADGRVVTKKELMKLTGLSSGSFSQEYIKAILRQNQVCQFKTIATTVTERQEKNTQKAYEAVVQENVRLKSKLQDAGLLHDKDVAKHTKLLDDYNLLKQQHEMLRGKYQQLMEYLDVLGADMSKMPLV